MDSKFRKVNEWLLDSSNLQVRTSVDLEHMNGEVQSRGYIKSDKFPEINGEL